MLSVIIPSYNEANHIQPCLDAIVAQSDLPVDHGIEVIVAANGCRDETVARARAKTQALAAAGFTLVVLDIARGNKMNALNEAEAAATHQCRVFLDADVIIGSRILVELAELLAADGPVYASGTVVVPRPRNLFSRGFAKVWTNLPFARDGVPGIGLYAVNAAGRARWGAFPDIIADDRFVRLQFAPHERQRTAATYVWPLPEGFNNLVKVRHRWKEGNLEMEQKHADLLKNDSEINRTMGNMLGMLRTPFSTAVYVLIYVVSNLRARQGVAGDAKTWQRGRN